MYRYDIEDELQYIVDELYELGVIDAEEKAEKLLAYMDLVLKKNEVMNLTSVTDRQDFIRTHILDSASCYGWDGIETAMNIVDIGTGAGFPGIVLAVLYPQKSFVLVDSLKKKLTFIEDAISQIGIKNVACEHFRAEDLGQSKFRESFDLCVSRAVSRLPVLLEYCIPLVKVGGFFYAYKTVNSLDEIDASRNALKLLGADDSVEVKDANFYDDTLGHKIYIISKVRNTPNTYPRKAGIPNKISL